MNESLFWLFALDSFLRSHASTQFDYRIMSIDISQSCLVLYLQQMNRKYHIPRVCCQVPSGILYRPER